jgi:hypothetical protein
MRAASPVVLYLLNVLVFGPSGLAQEATPAPAGGSCCSSAKGLVWQLNCFPRCGCPDDYCPNPYPRQCWPPYPPFYRCVPAGECSHPPCVGVGNEKLTWWFLPTPRALREALWCQP